MLFANALKLLPDVLFLCLLLSFPIERITDPNCFLCSEL